jgi:geranylgeranyl pyrophosphate synthase
MAQGAGCNGMIGGQLIDILSEGITLNEEELTRMHRLKTGRLISSSLALGCIVANEDPTPLKYFGDLIGLAFQIRDDIIDEADGGLDQEKGKATFVTLLGTKRAQEALDETVEKAFDHLTGPAKEALEELFSPLFVGKNSRLGSPSAV